MNKIEIEKRIVKETIDELRPWIIKSKKLQYLELKLALQKIFRYNHLWVVNCNGTNKFNLEIESNFTNVFIGFVFTDSITIYFPENGNPQKPQWFTFKLENLQSNLENFSKIMNYILICSLKWAQKGFSGFRDCDLNSNQELEEAF